MTKRISATRSKHLMSQLMAIALTLCSLVAGQARGAEAIVFYHNDILGSPIGTTDSAGVVCWQEDYFPYGRKRNSDDRHLGTDCGLASQGNERSYTNHILDSNNLSSGNADIGLTYAQARYYDQHLGRFYAMDPVGVDINQPAMFNRYAYGNNNPYKYTDPTGQAGEKALFSRFGFPGLFVASVIHGIQGTQQAIEDYEEKQKQYEEIQSIINQYNESKESETQDDSESSTKSETDNERAGKKSSDSSASERHGDGGRAKTRAEERIKELQESKKGVSKKERKKIDQKIQNIRKNAERKAKGETHSRDNRNK